MVEQTDNLRRLTALGDEDRDIIRADDRTALQTTSQFENLVRNVRSGDAVVLQVERNGKLQYLAFEME